MRCTEPSSTRPGKTRWTRTAGRPLGWPATSLPTSSMPSSPACVPRWPSRGWSDVAPAHSSHHPARHSSHSSHSGPLEPLVGAGLASCEGGFGGVGPNFLPWLVSAALLVCALLCVLHALTGGLRDLQAGSGAERAHWQGFLWVSAALLLNALLITTLGFILSCALCFVLSVRGFKSAEGQLDLRLRAWVKDGLIGVAVAGPVFFIL